jgi:ArsR family transcriptional regulator
MSTTTPPDAAQAILLFHALYDETRLEIVRRLASRERCVCELTDAMDAAQSRLSFHLKTLKTAGIVSDRREGRWVHYSLNPEVLESMGAFLTDLREARGWEPEGGCCKDKPSVRRPPGDGRPL